MGNTCGCTSYKQLNLTDFHTKNKYHPKSDRFKQTRTIQLLKQITPHQQQPTTNHINLASFILQQNKTIFNDIHFTNMCLPQKTNDNNQYQYLHKLFDYNRQHITTLYSQLPTSPQSFVCPEIQLSYLSTVFYLIGFHLQLKQKVFITKNINKYQCYVINMHCNGLQTQVIVDEKIPIMPIKQSIKHVNVINGRQLWMMLLEKAWCKQIGSYEKAHGLSPQDCFEQILGIPASTYNFSMHSPTSITKILQQASQQHQYWVCFTAKIIDKQSAIIKCRQVFYLEGVNKIQNDHSNVYSYKIKSPYPVIENNGSRGSYRNSKKLERMEMDIGELRKYFEYFTIGFYKKQYDTKSYNLKSDPSQDKIFQLQIHVNSFQFNLRLIQFYEEYLSQQDAQFYGYSSVLLELYDEKYHIIENCQCTAQGSRSTHLSKDTFVTLNKGLYYLRVQVDWVNPNAINSANILIYSPSTKHQREAYTFQQHTKADIQDFNNKFACKIIAQSLSDPNTTQLTNSDQQIKIRLLQKQARYVLGIENTANEHVKLKIIFKGSENLKVNHHHFKVQDGILEIQLDPFYERVLQFIPNDNKQPIFLAPFDIVKL